LVHYIQYSVAFCTITASMTTLYVAQKLVVGQTFI
jgi:hypothetical protein